MSTERRDNPCDQLRVPAELHGEFDRFFWNLKRTILERAATLATARAFEQYEVTMSADDLRIAAEEVLPQAVAELSRTLSRREFQHVRRAS